MSPSGDFLATTHSGQLGVYLWANRTLYAHVNLRPLDIKNVLIPTIGKKNCILKNNIFQRIIKILCIFRTSIACL